MTEPTATEPTAAKPAAARPAVAKLAPDESKTRGPRSEAVEVVRVTFTRKELTAQKVPALRELFALERLPLAETAFELELKGVPTAVASAIRRAVTDEMPGRALQVPPDGFSNADTTDPYMLPPFVNERIAMMRLRAQIPSDVSDNLRLALDVSNPGTSVLSVYSGDMVVTGGSLAEPIFNPTYKLAILQPGKRIVIRDIRITSGYGRDNAMYNVASCCANRPGDIPEHPRAEIYEEKGIAADLSGFTVSSLVANPRHHIVSGILPATAAVEAESRVVLVDACANIVARLRRIMGAITGGVELHGIRLTVAQLEGGLSQGILLVPNETSTIGEALRRMIFEIGVASVNCVASDGVLKVSVNYAGDVEALIRKAIEHLIETFETIRHGIADA